jgi:multidrug transporter EmrE-like cation transporter
MMKVHILLNVLGIAVTVGFTSLAQLILKWQLRTPPPLEQGAAAVLRWGLALLLNPWIIAVFGGAFLASLSWFFVVSRMPLSVAYPFVALTFPLVCIGSAILFGDPINPPMLIGLGLVVAGLVVTVLFSDL